MKIINGNVRIMREELARNGTPVDTGEIRIRYDTGTLSSNLTYHVKGEVQNRHAHLLLGGAHHVLAGLIEVQDDDGYWHELKDWQMSKGSMQMVSYDPGEFYNVRVPESAPTAKFPGAGPTIGAVTIFYKWVPPYLNIKKDEIQLLIDKDWFGENFLKDSTDKKSSPALRLDEAESKKFWEIVRRNREQLSDKWKKFDLQLYLG